MATSNNPFTDPRVIAAALGLGGGLLQGIGESKNADANRQLSREELLARMHENQQDRGLARTAQDLTATQMDPLAQQKSRQENAIRAALVGGARNFSITPPSDVAPYMPQISGGIRIPEGGFGKDVMDLFSPTARANAEAQFFSANPRVAPSSMEDLGYSNEAVSTANQALASSRSQMDADTQRSAAERQALMRALQQSQPEQKKGGGFKGFLGKVLGVAAPFANLIPGVGPLAALGLGAGASALGTKLQGGSWGDAALAGGASAAMGKFRGGAKPPGINPEGMVAAYARRGGQ